jgi:hypothetical protein
VKGAPIDGFDRHLLVHKLAALFEDEVAPLCLATFAGTEGAYEDTFGVRNEGVRELFLRRRFLVSL